MSKKRNRLPSSYDRIVGAFIPEYVADTGDKDWTPLKVALWAIEHNKWGQRKINAAKQLAKEIGRVARKVTFLDDESGENVRLYHSWKPGPNQPTFWSEMGDLTPERWTHSKNSRRSKLVGGMTQLVIDNEHFNKHHNPGDPILVETDLTKDVSEKRQPGLYDDTPPDDEPDQDTAD